MSYWKSKVLPKIKKFFDKGKRKGASEVCKSFDKSKESLDKEIEDKNPELHPKVVEIYRSATVVTQKLFKEPNETAVKDNPDAAQSALQELAKADFPGAQMLSDAGLKYGPALLPGPIVYILQKTSTFLVEEPLPETVVETREVPVEGEGPTEPATTEAAPFEPALEKEPDGEKVAEEAAAPSEEAPASVEGVEVVEKDEVAAESTTEPAAETATVS